MGLTAAECKHAWMTHRRMCDQCEKFARGISNPEIGRCTEMCTTGRSLRGSWETRMSREAQGKA